jgi:phage terminase large subunit
MKVTTATRKIANLKKRIWVVQGGQGAGKTFAILLFLINHASSVSHRRIFIASAELSKMKLGLIRDFIDIMKSLNLFQEQRLKGGVVYYFSNSSFIHFIGLDKEDVGKGLRSHIVFVNEANKCKFEEVRELISRAKRVIFDYNPNARFWIDDEIKVRSDAEELILTYNDNEFLSDTERVEIEDYKKRGFLNPGLEDYDFEKNIKSHYWANKWRVYGLGLYGKIDNAIYTDWTIGEFDDNLPYWFGLDFGYSNDPDAMVKVAIDESKGVIYIDECIYSTGQSSSLLSDSIGLYAGVNDLIIADSENPRLIEDLSEKYNIVGAVKWRVVERIKKVQSYKLIVTSNSLNLQLELENYVWSDKRALLPIDKYNHALDALGYAVTGRVAFEFSIR